MCKKKDHDDDGSVIANMNVEGMPWYEKPETLQKKARLKNIQVSREERQAMIKGAFLAYLPMMLVILISFAVVFLLLFLFFYSAVFSPV